MTHRNAAMALALTLLLGPASSGSAETAPAREPGASPAPGSFFLVPERISLKDGGYADAERGVLFVPLKRSEPEGAVVGIEIYRFPYTGSTTKVPPIFRLNGGPGFPGLGGSLEREGFYEDRIRPMTEIADLVVIGQRGIGSSRPNTLCGGLPDFPLDEKIPEEKIVAAFQKASSECRAHWESKGFDLTGFNVVEAAADVRDVARALGYEKVTLWGGSFGSHWGMTVMRFHPGLVERAVLTGMEGPDHTYDMPGWVLKALERMAKAAEASPELSGLIPEGGLIQALSTVIERLEAEPVMVSVADPDGDEAQKVRFEGEDVRDRSLGYTRRASSRGGIRTWPSDVLHLFAGKYEPMAEAALRRGGRRGLPTASFFMLDCGSGISPAREATLNADPAAAIVGRLGFFYQTTCPAWGSDLGEAFRESFETEIPTVIVHGTWDTSTPFENAKELAPYFKRSRFIPVHGGSHGALNEALDASEDFRAALTKFIREGSFTDLPQEIELPPVEWAVPEGLEEPAD